LCCPIRSSALSSIDFLLQESNPVAINSVVGPPARALRIFQLACRYKAWRLAALPLLARQGRVATFHGNVEYRVQMLVDPGRIKSVSSVVAYVIRMLSHVSRLLSGEEKKLGRTSVRPSLPAGGWRTNMQPVDAARRSIEQS